MTIALNTHTTADVTKSVEKMCEPSAPEFSGVLFGIKIARRPRRSDRKAARKQLA